MSREFVMGARINLNTGNYSSGMAQAIRQTQSFRQSVDNSSSIMRSFDHSVSRTETSMSQMGRQTGVVTREFQEQAQTAGTLRNSLSGLNGIIAAVAGSMAVKGAYNWMVGANADMEQYKNTLTVVLGSQQKAVQQLAWAQKFAQQTPFEIPQIVEATTRLESYGIQSKKVLGTIGDMASVMGKDLMQAVEAVADAQTGELERMKEFGITKSMIEDQAAAMGKVVTNNKGQITDLKAFNTALFAIMEKRFKGGMEMQSKSFKGMLSNASDFISSMGRRLGQPLFDKAKVGLQNFLGLLNRLQDSGAIDSFVKNTQRVGSDIWNAFSMAGSMIAGVLNAIKGPATATVGYLVNNFRTLAPYIYGVGSALLIYAGYLKMVALQTKFVTIATSVWNAVTKMSPIWLVAATVGLLIGYLIHLAGGWDIVKQKLIVFWGILVQTFRNIMAVVGPILTTLGQKLVQTWTTLLPYIVTALTAIKTALITWATNIWTTIGPFITVIWTGIAGIFTALVSFFQTWGPLILGIIQVVWAGISSLIGSAVKISWTIVKGGFTYIYNIISGIFKMVLGVIEVGWSIATGIFSTALKLLSGDWKGAWDSMLKMLKGVWKGIKDFFGGLKDLFWDSGKAIIKTLADGIIAAASAPVKAIKSVLGKVREFLPFSDAKTGPLSQLTHNGGKIVTTMAEGMYKKQGYLTKAMDSVLATGGTSGIAVSGNIPAGTVNPAGSTASAAGGSRKTVVIQKLVEKLEINGADGKDSKELAQEIIGHLVDILGSADEIESAGLGDLL